VAAAELAGEPVIELAGPGPARLVYAPDLLWSSPGQASGGGSPEPDAGTAWGRHHFESLFARGADPWRYSTPYERTKYEQTLSLIPPGPVGRALEIGCAEGHFSERLCARVGRLVAADISEIALRRAAGHCRGCSNMDFLRLDLARDPIPGPFGLVVCSETLYYLDGPEALTAAARRIAEALEPGGHLVMAHANVVADDPDRPGFDWDVPYGARTIGETFASTPGLHFVRELRTALYRVQLFRREEGHAASSVEPERVEEALHSDPEPAVAAHILWHGGRPVREEGARAATDRLPILLYHRVNPAGSPTTARYRVSPEAFEDQLRYLKDAGFHGVSLDEWAEAMAARRPLPGRAVAITFDDGYQDFLAWAWPALRRYGFSATMFLVAERIGGTNQWDAGYGEELPLLTWPSIRRLRGEGLELGSHALTHRALTALPNAQVARAVARSKLILEKGLGTPVTAFAYPWGMSDGAVRHFVGACGYRMALDSKGGRSPLHGNPLNVPRIEVEGSDDLEAFVAKLEG
jgi:peptidoglycan/xylan/chitin deacetylase (PgdA/CDA1 family)/2-polyprenyl-3-methyl-5-hydroxy-6-metoxy-1,4-benzoquinol methylase